VESNIGTIYLDSTHVESSETKIFENKCNSLVIDHSTIDISGEVKISNNIAAI